MRADGRPAGAPHQPGRRPARHRPAPHAGGDRRAGSGLPGGAGPVPAPVRAGQGHAAGDRRPHLPRVPLRLRPGVGLPDPPADYELPPSTSPTTSSSPSTWPSPPSARGSDRRPAQAGTPSQAGRPRGVAAPTAGRPPVVPALPALFDAYRRRARVGFTYRGGPRRLDPYGIIFRNGHWYVVGFDPDRDAIRAFRADRIESGIEPGPGGRLRTPGRLRSVLGAPGRALALRRRGARRGPRAGVGHPGGLGGGRPRGAGGGRAARRRLGGR